MIHNSYLLENNKNKDNYCYFFCNNLSNTREIRYDFMLYAKNQINKEYEKILTEFPLGTIMYRDGISTKHKWPTYYSDYTPLSLTEFDCDEYNYGIGKEALELTVKFLCVINKKEVEKCQHLQAEIHRIKSNFKLGYQLYVDNNPPLTDREIHIKASRIKFPANYENSPSFFRFQRPLQIIFRWDPIPKEGKDYRIYYQEIVNNERIIDKIDKIAKWSESQCDFSKYIRGFKSKLNLPWGCYNYNIPYAGKISEGKDNIKNPEIFFNVWQFCIESFCKAELDYSLCPNYSYDKKKDEALENGKVTFKTVVYDRILSFISHINYKDYTPVVVFADTDDRWELYYESYHFTYLRYILREANISEYDYFSYFLNPCSKHIIIVVDLITNNKQIKNFLSNFLCTLTYQHLFVYITLRKEYSKEEMQRIIHAKQKELDEKKAAEEAYKLKINQEAEKKRNEEERKKQEDLRQQLEIPNLKACVSSWFTSSRSSIPCFSLYNYYPTTCDWEVSQSEWAIRHLIWNFKANPHSYEPESKIKQSHKEAVDEIIPDIRRVLDHYFGNLQTKLTLVCIPSSKRIVSERRYKDFSERLCSATGMTNGYPYVHVLEEGEARHLGGTQSAQFSVEGSFFKDKRIILFDDVITSGRSMEKFRQLLESASATVICGMSIGKTKLERQESNPIERI